MYIFLRGFRRRMNGGAFNIRGPGLIESVEKGLEISCTIADQNRCFYIYWSLIKASKRHYKSNSIQFKQEGSLLYPVRIIFGCIFFSLLITAMIWAHNSRGRLISVII